jgi:hypothetical protein
MGLCHFACCLVQLELLLPMLSLRLAKSAMNAARSAILEVARGEVGLDVGHAPTRNGVLMVVLPNMAVTREILVLLMMLVLVLVVLIVLERLAKAHLHGSVVLLPCPPVHHDVVALVPMALVEHAELLWRRLAPGRSSWRRSVGVVEGDAGAGCGRPRAGGKVSSVLRMSWKKGLAGSPGVD